MEAVPTTEFEQFVIDQVHILGADVEEVSLDATLKDLGLDSLDVVELCQSARKSYRLDLSPKDFEEALTVSAVADVIARAAARQ